jgi:hypothetical protein
MTSDLKIIEIPKEEAVFWLDRHGRWQNDGGRFQRKKIIDYFHTSISRDKNGYFVSQIKETVIEKVYFRYEDTALFVFKVDFNDNIILTLNTGLKLNLSPDKLYIFKDHLYMIKNDETIKFAEKALFKISRIIEEGGDAFFIKVRGERYKIPEK